MNSTRSGRWHLARLTLGLAAVVALSEVIAPAATAVVGTTLFVSPATTTISPLGSTGGSLAATVTFNATADISGAGAALQFDKTRLRLTALGKDATLVANGVSYVGFPSAAGMATFIANANAAGEIPTIAWSYTDGSSSEAAGSDHPIFTATFTVIKAGDSHVTPVIVPSIGGLLDGRVATYGSSFAIDSIVSGAVMNALPTTSITSLSAWLLTSPVAVIWSATAGSNPLANYDVRYRKAAWNSSAFGAYTSWLSATGLTTSSLATAPGYTYCFSARARDTLGNVSAWTAETCTAVALDDRSLSRSGSWTLGTGSSYYRSTYVRATSSSAKLTRTGIVARKIFLVATTCSTCGSVKVYLGSTLLKSISLHSTTTVNRKVFTVLVSTSTKTGTLSIKVSTSGKKVIIDGLVVSHS